MVEQISFSINFGNIFASIPLNILDIETEKNSDIDESENFNANIQIYLALEKEYEEFIIIGINLNIIKRNSKKHPYNKNNFTSNLTTLDIIT